MAHGRRCGFCRHAGGLHLDQFTFARTPVIFSMTAPEYSSSTSMVASSIGSVAQAVDLLEQHLRAGDGQLEPFAAHVFDQNAHLEFAAAGNFKGVATGGVGDFDQRRWIRLLSSGGHG